MLISFQNAMDSAVDGSDGNVGTLRDLVFDRGSWTVRYLVVRCGGWVTRHRALLAPECVEQADWREGRLRVRPSRHDVKESPEVGEVATIPRRKEQELVRHFGWKPYWQTGPVGVPDGPGFPNPTVPERRPDEAPTDLWNAREVIDYAADALDGNIGSVGDVVFDDQAWKVRYLVIDVGSWLTGRRILAAIDWIDTIGWKGGSVRLAVNKSAIEQSPEYDPAAPIGRDYETRLHEHYGRAPYWSATDGSPSGRRV